MENYHQMEDLRFFEAIKLIQKSLSLEAMIVAQRYTPPTKEAFFSQTAEFEWDESLEELLEMLD